LADEDVDEAVRDAVEERCGDELLDEDADDVIDLVVLWWRERRRLGRSLINAIGPLADNGVIWVPTPRPAVRVTSSRARSPRPLHGRPPADLNATVSDGWAACGWWRRRRVSPALTQESPPPRHWSGAERPSGS
jgi:hypothetical protein